MLLLLEGCKPDFDHQKKSSNIAQHEQSEISEDVRKLIPDLEILETQALNSQKYSGIMKDCIKFADNLLYLSRKVMAKGRNPKINSQILDMTNRIVEVGRKVRNSFSQTDFFATSIMWDRIQVRGMTIQDLEKINLVTFDDSYASPESVEKKLSELNFVQESFGFYTINPSDELFYDIAVGNDELFKKFHEKLLKIGNDSSYSDKVQPLLYQVKARATKKIDEKDELEVKIHQLFKITEISEGVIIEKWMPCLKSLESLNLKSLKPEKVAEQGFWFSRSLVNLAAKTMVGSRNPKINSLILKMSSRTLKVMEHAKKAWLKAHPNEKLKDSAELSLRLTSRNDRWIRSWDILNLISYDENCNSSEIITNKLEEIINLPEEKSFRNDETWYIPHILDSEFWAMPDINWDLYYRIYPLIEDFYKKLQKVGIYNRKHDEKSQKFFDMIKEKAIKISKEKFDESVLILIRDLFRTDEISDEMIAEEWYPLMKFLEDSEPGKVAYLCYEFSKSLNRLAQEVMAKGRNPKINSLILEISSRLMKIKDKDFNEENHNFCWLNAGLYDINIRFWDIMNKIAYDDKCNSLEAVETELEKISPSNWTKIEGCGDDCIISHGCELPKEINQLVEKFHEKLEKVGGYKIKHSELVQKFLDKVQKKNAKAK